MDETSAHVLGDIGETDVPRVGTSVAQNESRDQIAGVNWKALVADGASRVPFMPAEVFGTADDAVVIDRHNRGGSRLEDDRWRIEVTIEPDPAVLPIGTGCPAGSSLRRLRRISRRDYPFCRNETERLARWGRCLDGA